MYFIRILLFDIIFVVPNVPLILKVCKNIALRVPAFTPFKVVL
jgi:hypothetical protein